jgi:hypothetical protein
MTPDLFPDDPEIVATLEAIDATLAGEAVDPRHAELAELALMLAADRPVMPPASAAELDERRPWRAGASQAGGRQRVRRWWVWAPATAVMASLVVAVVIVVGQGGSSSGVSFGALDRGLKSSASSAAGILSPGPTEKRPAAAVHHHASFQAIPAPSTTAAAPPSQSGGGAAAAGNTADQPGFLANATAVTAPTAGRKVIQGAQLSLSTSSKRVDQVAQEVFNVIGQQKGIVKSSRVTSNGGQGGYAQFQLAVPSGNLGATMSALSNLQYARVSSRTDSSQDVTNQYRVDQRHLADDQALRTSLLKQLADAVTQAQIDSLTARIHDAEGAISSDERALNALNRSVNFSQIYVSVNAGSVPVPVNHGSGGFTLRKAVHDAGRVLTVAAGVALIVLAALLPVALVVALLWWIGSTVRHRRRMQALDLY